MLIRKYLWKVTKSHIPGSYAARLRLRRFDFFKSLFKDVLEQNTRILDAGGTIQFWENMDFVNQVNIDITILNLDSQTSKYTNIHCVTGNAIDMSEFDDNSFDIVFSNSMLEHIGPVESQRKFAGEIKRLSSRYFIQTPNYYFPIEPHFVFFGFQFLPLSWRAFLLKHLDMAWFGKNRDYQQALNLAQSIRLLKKKVIANQNGPGKVILVGEASLSCMWFSLELAFI